MATALSITQHQSKQATRSETISATESLTLVRNLMRTGISAICYLRNLFPDECFSDKSISGIQIKSLIAHNDESRTLIEWLEKGVFDALNKRYLKTILFAVCKDSRDSLDSVIESYEFHVSYPNSSQHNNPNNDNHGDDNNQRNEGRNNNSVHLNISKTSSSGKKIGVQQQFNKGQTKTEITQSMVMLLRTLITLSQTLKPIPESRCITMKLLYYDHVTPAEYEPPFFKPVDESEARGYEKDFIKLRVGKIATSYHSMDVKIRTAQNLFDYDDDPLLTEHKEVTRATREEENFSQQVQSQPTLDNNNNNNMNHSPTGSQMTDSQETQISLDETRLESEERSPDITTILEQDSSKRASEKRRNSVELDHLSSSFQHKNKISPTHKSSKKPSSADELYYQALSICLNETHVFSSKLQKKMDISAHQAKLLLDRMDDDGFLGKSTNRRTGRPVIQSSKSKTMLKKVTEWFSRSTMGDNDESSSPEIENSSQAAGQARSTNSQQKPIVEETILTSGTLSSTSQLSLSGISQKSVVNAKSQQATNEANVKKGRSHEPKVTYPNIDQPSSNQKLNNKRKRIEENFEVCHSQDTMNVVGNRGDEMLDEFDYNETFPKMSTAQEPISHKRRKITRDNNFTFGAPAKKIRN